MAAGLADFSGAIVAAGVSQQQTDRDSGRSYLLVQNLSAEPLYVRFGQAAAVDVPGNIRLSPSGGTLEYGVSGQGFVPGGSVNLAGATPGSKFTCLEG